VIGAIAGSVLNCADNKAGTKNPKSISENTIIFSNMHVSDISPTRAVVQFDTSVPTSCIADFGTSSDKLDMTATDPTMIDGQLETDHNVALEDLRPNTTYYYQAVATDANNYTERSDIQSFETSASTAGDDTSTNIAAISAGTTVAAVSSNFGDNSNESAFGAHKALDGLMSTEWASNGDGDNAYIELDFGLQRTIRSLRFRSRTMADGSSIITRFQLSNRGRVIGSFDTPDPDKVYEYELDVTVSTQKIRLDAIETTGGNTGIKELQFY